MTLGPDENDLLLFLLNDQNRLRSSFYELTSLSDTGRVRELQTLCDLIGERSGGSLASPSGQQELFPGSGIFISSFRLAAMNHASKPNCMRLFHALFDNFFTVEECQNAVPFGHPGNNPSGKEGKQVLDCKKVDWILSTFFFKDNTCFIHIHDWPKNRTCWFAILWTEMDVSRCYFLLTWSAVVYGLCGNFFVKLLMTDFNALVLQMCNSTGLGTNWGGQAMWTAISLSLLCVCVCYTNAVFNIEYCF